MAKQDLKTKGFGYFEFKTCPICKRKFIPAPQHAWKNACQPKQLVCTYPCHVKSLKQWEAKQGEATRRRCASRNNRGKPKFAQVISH